MNEDVGFFKIVFEESIGLLEEWVDGGRLVILEVDTMMVGYFSWLYFLLDFVFGIGPVVENGENAIDMVLFEQIHVVENSNITQVNVAFLIVVFIERVNVAEVCFFHDIFNNKFRIDSK